MNSKKLLDAAYALFYEAHELQMQGDLEEAIELYRRSIDTFPTAEAYTFLGWTYSFQGRLDEAIAECKKAIQIDPDFGNPYNDIGAYLIEKSQYEESIPWLLNAAGSKNYNNHHFAHYNLARAYIGLEQFNKAKEEFENALRISPQYEMARDALGVLKQRIQ
jgi:tetratricopeptide (TPR) repeat protein